jgi:hypothetical protein
LLFYSQGQGPVKISEIEIAGWDGSIRDGGESESEAKADLVTLSNGDKVSGELLGVANDEITFSTSFAPELKIPMERVANIEFAGEKVERPEPAPGKVRAYFQGEGSLLLDLKSLTRETAAVATEAFGEANLRPAALRMLRFNLDRTDDDDEGEDGDGSLGFSDMAFD